MNARGWVVVAIFSIVSLAAGLNAGSFRRDLMWRADWSRVTVASNCKGDRL
jgi:hypothetical protein